MSKIYIIRSAPYKYQIEGLDLYDSFDAVARDQIAVELEDFALEYYQKNLPSKVFVTDEVICSSRIHSLSSAKLIHDNPTVDPLLNEIRYTMTDILSKEEFLSLATGDRVDIARKTFFRKLLKNELSESFNSLVERVTSLEEVFINSNQDLVCVSHGFYIKVLELIIQNPEIKLNPEKLLEYYDGSTETFKFGEGFIIDNSLNQLTVVKEIKSK